MSEWIVKAPNGDSVTVSIGLGEGTFKHNSIVKKEGLAAAYPEFFIPLGEPVKQILTEVPKPVEFTPETDKPDPVEEVVEEVEESVEEDLDESDE